MTETALPTTSFTENAGMTVSRVSGAGLCGVGSITLSGEKGSV